MNSIEANTLKLESQVSDINENVKRLVLEASRQSFSDSTHNSVLGFLHKQANARSADYISKYMSGALYFFTREELWNHTLSLPSIEGLKMEFGVADGYSINHLAKGVSQIFYGFDSFHGLPTDWPGASLQQDILIEMENFLSWNRTCD